MNKTFKFELSSQHLNIIVQALGNAPYSAAAPVLNELQAQVNAQPTPPAPPAEGENVG